LHGAVDERLGYPNHMSKGWQVITDHGKSASNYVVPQNNAGGCGDKSAPEATRESLGMEISNKTYLFI